MHARNRRFALVSTLVALILGLALWAGCSGGGDSGEVYQWKPLFGDFTKDNTPVVAQVGEFSITERDLELYLDEMPPAVKTQYKGPEGERLALKRMVEQVIMVQGAIESEIYNDPGVARNLISLRRNTLEYAMRNVGLLKGKEPTEEELRQFFMDNRSNYRTQGRVLARHIECRTKENADAAYARLQSDAPTDAWAYVLKDYSTNVETKADEGNLGWFSRGGFIPKLATPLEFANTFADRDVGLYAPEMVKGTWHIVEITQKVHPRNQTFNEARQKVLTDMLPGYQDAIVKDYLKSRREDLGVELLGRFAPGQGMTGDELFGRAMAITDPVRKVEMLTLLQADFPEHERADDALFMAAYAAMEAYEDLRVADRLLLQLLTEYPDTELKDDAQYLRENLYNPRVRSPQSVEDLRQGN